MAECSLARCQQERRTIRKELQRWTKNMVYILGLERVAEELMGRRKWKLYQDALLPRRSEPGDLSSDEESMPASDGPPAGLKIKTIEQINAPEDDRPKTEPEPETRTETILESLIRTPATQPKLKYEEPKDWQPADMDKCHFCVEGDRGGEAAAAGGAGRAGGAMSPASESDSSSVSGPKSPATSPMLLQHLLQLQAQNPQAIAQFQQMMAALAALNSGLVPPALSQAWLMQRLVQNRQTVDRVPSVVEKPCNESPLGEQPLDLSAKSSSTGGSPPPENSRPKKTVLESSSTGVARRAYSEDDLQAAVRDIRSGKLGTRRASVVYGIPRSTLRNKVYKLASPTSPPPADSDPDSEPERDSPPGVILKIPTFPLPDEKPPSPATPGTTPVTPLLPPRAPQPLLLPPSVFADPPNSHLFTSISDVIAKSISQKFQQPQDLDYLRRAERHVSVIKTPPDNHQRHHHAPHFPAPGNSRAPPSNNGQQALGGKGTRPKRGKYRNYDRDSLVEAVKAVQRGEMSVHRAGSYYGVPHSTLEYKVKERHLMRPRKREPKPPQDAKPPPKPPQKPPPKPFTNGMNGPDAPGYPPGYPFWAAPGFVPQPPTPNDLYASHMMRRLRDEAPPANGSFLEGIIRSSLERPGAALLQRLTEPRGVPGAAEAPSLLRRLAGSPGAGGAGGAGVAAADGPPARRARLGSGDRQLAAEMRETIQRLRADKQRRASPSPPPAPAPPAPAPAPPPPAERA